MRSQRGFWGKHTSSAFVNGVAIRRFILRINLDVLCFDWSTFRHFNVHSQTSVQKNNCFDLFCDIMHLKMQFP